MIKGATGLGEQGISAGLMGIKSDKEQKLEKKKSKAAERNELEPFKDLNWESSKNSGSELHDASLWTTVDQFTKE